jgi:hypothetical protein
MEEAKTSYYHKSIGGYHPAKLGIYDDLIAYQFKGNINMSVVNMLNAKYFIQQQENGKIAKQNPGALGNVWFVKGVQYVQGPANEMRALDNFNPKDTAIVDESFKNTVGNFSAPDSLSTIKQTSFDNDAITYESNSSTNNIAVFSEIFYKDWFAYVDGNPAAFVITIPDINQIIIYMKGKTNFFAKLKFAYYRMIGKMDRLRVVIMGVKPAYQKSGLESALIMKSIEMIRKTNQYKEIELSWVGDFNPKMRALHESVGAVLAKTHYTYRCLFSNTKDLKRATVIARDTKEKAISDKTE